MSADANPLSCPTAPILVVESDPQFRAEIAQFITDSLGWRTIEASDSCTALAAIQSTAPQIILASLNLPGRPVLEFLDQLRRDVPNIPVVVLMSPGSESTTLRALQRGAAGYASLESFTDELPEILERVISAAQSHRDRKRLQSSVTRMEMDFHLENDTALVPALVAEVQDYLAWMNFLDRPARVRLGVALEEALLNAMIHGNLEVSSVVKQQNEQQYRQLIESRRTEAPYRNRRVHFAARLRSDRAVFTVADRGAGYEPDLLPDPTDPANLDKVSGRGLLLIRTFMDDVKFNRKGNRITMVKFDLTKPFPNRQGRKGSRNAME